MRRGREGIRAHHHWHVGPSPGTAHMMRLDPAALMTPPYVWVADRRAVCVLRVCKGGAPSIASCFLFRYSGPETHAHSGAPFTIPSLV